MPVWTKVNAGLINAAQQRFWYALGSDAESVARRMVDPKEDFAVQLAIFAQSGKTYPKLVAMSQPLTRLYMGEEIVVGATTGDKTFANAKDVFNAYLDPNFERRGTNKRGKATERAPVAIYEIRMNATFREVFSSLDDPGDLVLTQEQVIDFCREHHDKLRQDGYATFFLFEVDDEVYVAVVYVSGSKLGARVFHFGHDGRWDAGYQSRVVVPQL